MQTNHLFTKEELEPYLITERKAKPKTSFSHISREYVWVEKLKRFVPRKGITRLVPRTGETGQEFEARCHRFYKLQNQHMNTSRIRT